MVGARCIERFQKFFHVPPTGLARGEALIARHGAFAIFFARFIFGLRMVIGPLAGVLRMRWRVFFFYNLLGSAAWVTLIASVGYLFGRHWGHLMRVLAGANLVILIGVAAVAIYFFWSRRKNRDAEANRG